MTKLLLRGFGVEIDLYPWLDAPEGMDGIEALEGIEGFGFPTPSVQWFEGAGDGSQYRSTRFERREISIPLIVEAQSRDGLNLKLSMIAKILRPTRQGAEKAQLVYSMPNGEEWFVDVVFAGGGNWARERSTTNLDTWLRFNLELSSGDPFWQRVQPEEFSVEAEKEVVPERYINKALNPSFFTAAGAYTDFDKNWATDPRATLSANWYGHSDATFTRTMTTFTTPQFPNIPALNTACKITATSAGTYLGVISQDQKKDVLYGETYFASMYVLSSKAQRMRIFIEEFNVIQGSIGSNAGNSIIFDVPAGVWFEMSDVFTLGPDTEYIKMIFMTNGNIPIASGDYVMGTAARLSFKPGTYFDGIGGLDASSQYTWESGTPNGHSLRKVRKPNLIATDSSTVVYQSSLWSNFGSNSLLIDASMQNSGFTHVTVADMSSSLQATLQAGKRYTVIAVLHLLNPGGSSPMSQRTISYVRESDSGSGFFSQDSDPAPNTAGSHVVSLSFTVPATSTQSSLRLNGNGYDSYAFWDSLTIVEIPADALDYEGIPFDGDNPPEGSVGGWLGTPHASMSEYIEPASNMGLLPQLAELKVGYAGAFGEREIENEGDAEAWPMWYADGPFTSLKLMGSDGEILQWNGSILAGQGLIIDSKNATIVDYNGVNRYDGLNAAPRFWAIYPGISSVSVEMLGSASGSKIICRFAPRRMSII